MNTTWILSCVNAQGKFPFSCRDRFEYQKKYAENDFFVKKDKSPEKKHLKIQGRKKERN